MAGDRVAVAVVGRVILRRQKALIPRDAEHRKSRDSIPGGHQGVRGVHRRVLVGRTFLILGRVIAGGRDIETFRGQPAQGHATGGHVLVALVIDDATARVGGRDLTTEPDPGLARNARSPGAERSLAVDTFVVQNVHVAIPALARERDPRKERIGNDRDIPGASVVPPVVVTELRAQVTFTVAGRSLRDQADRTADCVLAEERSLRTAQHLDVIEIQQIQNRALGPPQVHTVDVNRYSGFERKGVIGQADAADVGGDGRTPACAQRIDDRVRHELRELRDVSLPTRRQGVTRDGGDRERRFLQLFGTEPGGDRHLFQRPLGGRRRCCGGRLSLSQRNRRH